MPGVVGIVKGTVAAVRPVPGTVFDPFRYFQSSNPELPVANRPTQSVALPGPLVIVAVTVATGATAVALTVNVTAGGTVTVMVGLVARSTLPV